MYNDYDNYVPTYLKNMLNVPINFKNTTLNNDTYISIVNLLNSLIGYLNRNFTDDTNKKQLVQENNIPNSVELAKLGKKEIDFYNKDIVAYWDCYIVKKGA